MALACGHCGQVHDPFVARCPVTGARLAAAYTLVSDDEALLGSVVAERYHLRVLLGQGATGTVFGAEHLHFARPAAMKVLRPRYVSQENVLRIFHGEARAAWAVSHPSLCEVFDIGTLPDGAPFFVMERVFGDRLSSRLGREQLSSAAATDLAMQLLSAIDTIHGRALLARDLRPENLLLLSRRGCRPLLKILDFGLARLLPANVVASQWERMRAEAAAEGGSSVGGGVLTMPYYLSPERARGGEHGVEPASDLFVVGLLLYEALAGRRPFEATSVAGLVERMTAGPPLPISAHREGLPAGLDAFLARALAPDPRARPASAAEMQDELRNVFEGGKRTSTPVRAAPPSVAASEVPVALDSDPPVHTALMRFDATTPSQVGPVTPLDPTLPGYPAPGGGPPGELQSTRAIEEEETRTGLGDGRDLVALSAAALDEASADSPLRTLRPPQTRTTQARWDDSLPPTSTPPTASERRPMREGRIDIQLEIDVDVGVGSTSRNTEMARVAKAMRARDKDEDDLDHLAEDVSISDSDAHTLSREVARVLARREEEETATMDLTPELRARIDAMTRPAQPATPEPAPAAPSTSRKTPR